jgi:Na+:H+ antiporter, NhaA family
VSTITPARFLRDEAAGGIALLTATAVALAWANSPWDASYHSVWTHDVRHVVNDGLMSLFFLVVGLEIKRELVHGDLHRWRTAALPAIAAVGGMVVPAGIYAVTAGGSGWGIPMATDIAFAVGVLALLGRRVPSGLRLFLLTLAVVDDIGAVVVIALFYGGGVHPSLIGVAIGLLLPTRRVERLENALHPITAFAVVPIFVLANTGVRLDVALDGRIALGIVLGLVVGKPLGIGLAAWAAVRLRLGVLPGGVTWPQLVATGAVAGVGFTVSLFVAGLAFADDSAAAGTATVAVMGASVLAASFGLMGLTFWRSKT